MAKYFFTKLHIFPSGACQKECGVGVAMGQGIAIYAISYSDIYASVRGVRGPAPRKF